MKKAILLFALLLSAMNIMAQAYEFETEEKIQNDGKRYVKCETKEDVELDVSAPDISLDLFDIYNENNIPFIRFRLFKFARDSYRNSFAVAKRIRNLAFSIPVNDVNEKHNLTISLYLSNGDILRGTDRGIIDVSSVMRHAMEKVDSFGVVNVSIGTSFLVSSRSPKEIQTKENQQLICQQLRTYDIVKIEVDGVSFDVRGLRSAATFDAMFNALAAKTGKGHLYRYNSSSSSSSSRVSSGPSATCELGFVAVYSWGGIGCRVDDFRIVGAKGKDVEVNAIFEDVTDEYVSYGFVKKLTSIPYDDCTYDESFSVRGKVEELARLKRYNRAKFKVYIEVDVGNRCIYTSNAKYVTIYRDGDSWRCTRHD